MSYYGTFKNFVTGRFAVNKSERLHDMMLFLNDKNSFHLADIMRRYGISKSTALRDVASLERIGMPMYTEYGRNGAYRILQNRLLSPILFTLDEVFALYFSMCTLQAYETTPFHLSVDKLKEKFEKCLAPEKIRMLRRMEKVFTFGAVRHNHRCRFLREVLRSAVEGRVCSVSYAKDGIKTAYVVQFFDISASYGQWYATGYDFETKKPRVFRCDKIMSLVPNGRRKAKLLSQFIKNADALYKTQGAVEFEVAVSEKGADLFYKEHYPSMKLYAEHGAYIVKGFYNRGEEAFIAQYFIGYGENVLSVKPAALKKLIAARLKSLSRRYT